MKENKIEQMIEQLKKLHPGITVREQPQASLNELISFENEYEMTTKEAMEYLEELGEDVHFEEKYNYLTKWRTELSVYRIHKGDIALINQYRKKGE